MTAIWSKPLSSMLVAATILGATTLLPTVGSADDRTHPINVGYFIGAAVYCGHIKGSLEAALASLELIFTAQYSHAEIDTMKGYARSEYRTLNLSDANDVAVCNQIAGQTDFYDAVNQLLDTMKPKP